MVVVPPQASSVVTRDSPVGTAGWMVTCREVAQMIGGGKGCYERVGCVERY